MADTIESFVKKLQTEGVQAGQTAAEEIRAEAERQALQILKQAETEAQKVLSDAKVQAESIVSKGRNELKLAVRDAVLRLRETVARCLQLVLAGPVEQQFNDAEFLRPFLQEVITQYMRADSEGMNVITINVPDEQRKRLLDWAIGELREAAETPRAGSIDIKGTLARAGFEYKVSGATVDVTVDSVVETLSELIGPELSALLNQATEGLQMQNVASGGPEGGEH